ncbi:hypothetical protein ACFL6S_24920 [Candidatus Poribacteria bacterium]
MITRYRHVVLVSEDNPKYQAYVQQLATSNWNNNNSDLGSLHGVQIEDAVRRKMTTRKRPFDRKILRYEQCFGGHWDERFLEIDAVVWRPYNTPRVIEIKYSKDSPLQAIKKGCSQLRKRCSVLTRGEYACAEAVMILVTDRVVWDDVSEILEPMEIRSLSSVSDSLRNGETGLIIRPLRDVLRKSGMRLDTKDNIDIWRREGHDQVLNSRKEEDGIGSFGTLLSQAMEVLQQQKSMRFTHV